MEVRCWMTEDPITVRPLDSVARVREILETKRINQLPVVVEGRLVGIVTDRDLRDAFPSAFDAASGRRSGPNPAEMPVEMVMTPHVLTVEPTDDLVYAAVLMRRERIGSLPVVEGKRLVGILTRTDILSAFIHQASRAEQGCDREEPRGADSSAHP